MARPDFSPDNADSFARFIYNDLRDEQKALQRAMFTVLGLLALALGYILKNPDGQAPSPDYLLASQVLWIAFVLEILLFSDYLHKTKFLIEMEESFEQDPASLERIVPWWRSWAQEHEYRRFCAYTLSVFLIAFWAMAVMVWLWYQIIVIDAYSSLVRWGLLPLEVGTALLAAIMMLIEFRTTGGYGEHKGRVD